MTIETDQIHSEAIRTRIESELRSLGLPDSEIGGTAEKIIGSLNYILSKGSVDPDTSSLLNIKEKVLAVVEAFKNDGLTVAEYLAAAKKQPQLFYQSPATIAANIRGVVGEFAADGLTVADYLVAAKKRPPLFCQSPATIAANIRGAVGEFAADGLTVAEYLAAAKKQPSLFTRSPATIAANIRGVVGEFAADGLTVAEYLVAVKKQPPLFYQSPATIAGHINIIKCGYEEGVFTTTKPNDFWSILKIPAVLCLADENLFMRYVLAKFTEPMKLSALVGSKKKAQDKLRSFIVNDPDLDQLVTIIEPDIDEPGLEVQRSGGELLHRALQHAGLLSRA